MSHQVQRGTQGSPHFLLWSILRKLYFRSDSPFPGQQLVLLLAPETMQESTEDIPGPGPVTPGKDARSITGLYKTGTFSHYQGKAAGRHKHCPMQCIPLQVKNTLFFTSSFGESGRLPPQSSKFLSKYIKWTLLAQGVSQIPRRTCFYSPFFFSVVRILWPIKTPPRWYEWQGTADKWENPWCLKRKNQRPKTLTRSCSKKRRSMRVKQRFSWTCQCPRKGKGLGTLTSSTPPWGDMALQPASLREGNILTAAETATVQAFFPLSHSVFGRHVEMGLKLRMLSR